VYIVYSLLSKNNECCFYKILKNDRFVYCECKLPRVDRSEFFTLRWDPWGGIGRKILLLVCIGRHVVFRFEAYFGIGIENMTTHNDLNNRRITEYLVCYVAPLTHLQHAVPVWRMHAFIYIGKYESSINEDENACFESRLSTLSFDGFIMKDIR